MASSYTPVKVQKRDWISLVSEYLERSIRLCLKPKYLAVIVGILVILLSLPFLGSGDPDSVSNYVPISHTEAVLSSPEASAVEKARATLDRTIDQNLALAFAINTADPADKSKGGMINVLIASEALRLRQDVEAIVSSPKLRVGSGELVENPSYGLHPDEVYVQISVELNEILIRAANIASDRLVVSSGGVLEGISPATQVIIGSVTQGLTLSQLVSHVLLRQAGIQAVQRQNYAAAPDEIREVVKLAIANQQKFIEDLANLREEEGRPSIASAIREEYEGGMNRLLSMPLDSFSSESGRETRSKKIKTLPVPQVREGAVEREGASPPPKKEGAEESASQPLASRSPLLSMSALYDRPSSGRPPESASPAVARRDTISRNEGSQVGEALSYEPIIGWSYVGGE
jgi:hypothetical protein